MVGACECRNEPSGSVKCVEFLDWLRTSLFLKKGFSAWFQLNISNKLIACKKKSIAHGQETEVITAPEFTLSP